MEILPVFIRALRDRPTLHKAVLEILEKLHDPASNNET
jgi:hypothetical protein